MKSLAPLALMAAFALAAPAARAQQTLTLGNGDAVTVNGTGTQGTVNNGTNTYDDTGSANDYAVETNGSSNFTLAGGALTDTQGGAALYANGSGSVTVTGGTLNAADNGVALYAAGSGPVNISGGTFTAGQFGYGALALGSGPVNISGGTFTAGAGGYGLYANGGTITLFSRSGTLFQVDGVDTPNGTLPSGTSGDTISGTLLDGEAMSTTFLNGGTITLNPAPEPSPFAALGIGLLGLVGLAINSRKRLPG